jgi:hypothetical protein
MNRGSLAPIVRVLGGDLYAAGRRANVPGPGHSPHDRSVSLLLSGRRVLAHSFAGDDWRDVLADLRRRGLVDDAGRLTGNGGEAVAHEVVQPRLARAMEARRIWGQACPIRGTAAERHLRLRGLDAAQAADLAAHPGLAAAVYADRGPRRPALLAAIRDPGGAIVGLEATYLAPNGARARMRLPRKTIGLCPPGSAVRLAAAAPRMLVAEGVATTLSGSALFGLPGWALLAVRNLARWRPPPGVRFVLIAADRGRAGEAGAAALTAALAALGVASLVRPPPPPFGDWNEVLAGQPAAPVEMEEGPDRAGLAGGWSAPQARSARTMSAHRPSADDLVPLALRAELRANAAAEGRDPPPVLKLFNPAGPGTWLVTELDADEDTLFGLCDLDMGCPELGSVSLSELLTLRLPFGLSIERDLHFRSRAPLSRWAEVSRKLGSIRAAEAALAAGAGPG